MRPYAIAFGASFIYVFFRAFQQLNVVHGNYTWVLPVSLAMAVCDLTLIVLVIDQEKKHKRSLLLALPVGFGGALGAVSAMLAHGLLLA